MMTMAPPPVFGFASARSLVVAALIVSSASSLLVVPSSITNANKRNGAHHLIKSAHPSYSRQQHHPFAREHDTSRGLFAKRASSDGQFSSDKHHNYTTQQKKKLAIFSLLLVGILKSSTQPACAAARKATAKVSSTTVINIPKFLLRPSSRVSVAVLIGVAIWAVLRSRINSHNKSDKSSLQSSNGVGIPNSGVLKAGVEPLPLSTEWIEAQLKLAKEMKKKNPQFPKVGPSASASKKPPSLSPLSSDWIEQQMNDIENEKKKKMQVSKKPAVDEPPRMSPPPL